MGTTTISLSDERKDRFDEVRPENTRSAGEFIGLLLDAWEGESDGEMPPGLDELATATPEEIQDLKDDIRRDIEKVPERTADELEGRLR